MQALRPAIPEEMDEVRTLFREYAASLGVDLCFQNFDKELAELPGNYDVILIDETLAGCVALRPLQDGIAEMKRMYVRPQARGQGLGRQLAKAIIQAAIGRGYRSIRLDTLPHLHTAIAMYRKMGFKEIAPYTNNPVTGALFMELKLETPGRITGFGGIFFKSPNHESLRAWYRQNLGIAEGSMLSGAVCSIFPAASEYFSGGHMFNYTVDDLDAFLAKCEAAGIRIDPKRDEAEYGRFAWIYDPDGNKIELWQPAAS